MKLLWKLLKIVLFLAVLIVIIGYSLLFTQTGNDLIRPQIQSYISNKIAPNFVKITTFSLSFSDIKFNMTYNNKYRLFANGDFDFFDKTIDVSYDIKTLNEEKLKVNLTGVVKSNIQDRNNFNMKIDGQGKIMDAKIFYKTTMTDSENLRDFDFSIVELDLNDILEIINKPKYLNTNMDIDIKSKNLNLENINLTSTIKINKATLNSKVIKELFDIAVPEGTKFNGNIDTNIKNNIASSSIKIDSDLMRIRTLDTVFDINSHDLSSDYYLNIFDLSKLEFLISKKLIGKAKFQGDLSFKQNKLSLQGSSHVLDTNTTFDFKNNLVSMKSDGLYIPKLLNMLGYPNIYEAFSDLSASYDVSSKIGNYSLDIGKGHLAKSKLSQRVKLLFGFDMTKTTYNNGDLIGTIKGNILDLNATLYSHKNQIQLRDSSIDMLSKQVNSTLSLMRDNNESQIDGIKITGNINNPKIHLKPSKVVKTKIKKEIKRHIKNEEVNKFLDKLF